MRQNPTRLPYSNIDSAARSRPLSRGSNPPNSVSVASDRPSLSGTEYSDPSS